MTFTANCQIVRNNQNGNYSQLDNRPARDRNLSAEARGTLWYLASNSDRWHLTMQNLADMMNMGINRTRRVIAELRQGGLIQCENGRNEAGRYIGWQYRIVLPPELRGQQNETLEPLLDEGSSSTRASSTRVSSTPQQTDIIKFNSNKTKKINLSPVPQVFDEDEIDFWAISDPEPEAGQAVGFVPMEMVDPETVEIDLEHASPTKDLGILLVSGEGEFSAAHYKKPTIITTKPTRSERRTARKQVLWLEFGRENGLWQSMEELNDFMGALYTYAVNNPRLHTPGKWAESEVRKVCEQGTSTHWMEHRAGLQVGSIDRKPWRDVYGNVDLSFRSYVEQSKFGESGNSTSRAVELAAQVLCDPFKTGLMWNEYQRRLERELEEKAKCERLGITYDAPNVLKPKLQLSVADTARTQQILGIDAAPQTYQPAIVESAPVPVLEDAEDEPDWGEAPWDKVAADVMAKMAALGEKMGISKSKSAPEVTPLSEVYAESKFVNQKEAQEFKIWFDLAKAAGLVDYSYSDAKHHAIVVLADGVTALPWREAKQLSADRLAELE
jgi:predicted transcriptional regulator